MRRILLAAVVLMLAAAVGSAAEFNFGADFTVADFEQVCRVLGDATAFPAMGPAEPSGITGFDIMAVVGGPRVDSGASWWRHGISGSATGDVLPTGRVVAHKGLPFGIDVGGQIGEVLGQRFWGVDAKVAIMDGGTLTPSVAVRGSFSRLSSGPVDFRVAEAQISLSKGFALLTPYVGAGARWIQGEAQFGPILPVRHEVREQKVMAFAGLRLSLLPLRIVAEVRQGSTTAGFVGVGVGL